MEEVLTELEVGKTLKQEERLYSPNKEYFLFIDHLGILKTIQLSTCMEVWNNSTKVKASTFTPPYKLMLEEDALFTIDSMGLRNWEIQISGREPEKLCVSDEGLPQLMDEGFQKIWPDRYDSRLSNIGTVTVRQFYEHLEQKSMAWQHLLVLVLFISGIAFSMFSALLSYMLVTPELICTDVKSLYSKPFICSVEQACSGLYNYKASSNSFDNWMTDYQILCSNNYLHTFLIVLIDIGLILGSCFFMPLTDKFGRKQILTLNIIATSLVCLKIITSMDLYTLIVCLIALGMLTSVYYNIAYMMALEISSMSFRAIYTCIIFSSAPIGRMIMHPLLYKLHHWKTVMIIITIASFFLIMIISFFVDSPRYYVSRYDYGMATTVAKKLMRRQDIIFEDYDRQYSIQQRKWMKLREEEAYPFIELFKYPSVQAATYIMVICCFNFNNMYKGMVLLSERSDTSYNYMMISSAYDFAACIIAGFLLTRFGRMNIIEISFNITCWLAIFISVISYFNLHIISLLISINRFTSLVTLCGGYLYAIEAFPTRIRGTGIGFCSMFSNVGKVLALAILKMGDQFTFIFGIVGLIGFYMLKLVPQIKDMREDNLIDEIVEVSSYLKFKH